jgi:hypothetical protein
MSKKSSSYGSLLVTSKDSAEESAKQAEKELASRTATDLLNTARLHDG